MVQENTKTVEVVESVIADYVNECIHFDGEKVSVGNYFDTPERTADIDAFEAALDAIEAGVQSVEVNDTMSVVVNTDRERYGKGKIVLITYDSGSRVSSVGELRDALEQSRDI